MATAPDLNPGERKPCGFDPHSLRNLLALKAQMAVHVVFSLGLAALAECARWGSQLMVLVRLALKAQMAVHLVCTQAVVGSNPT